MPVYNGQKYLNDSIQSILNQSLKEFELIIVNDGSTDQTADILREYSDPRIRVLTNPRNSGVAFSLNRAIEVSRGVYIARMDSDDISLPYRLKLQTEYLESHPDISLIGGSIQCFGTSDDRIRYWEQHDFIHANCLFNTPFAHPVVCWRKEDFLNNHLLYQESPPTAEDYELWERACQTLKTANLPEILIHYRIDPLIKISQYLQQQIDGGKRVRERSLERAGIVLNKTELELLHKIGEGFSEGEFEYIQDSGNLLRKIMRLNQLNRFYDENAIRGVVRKWYYDLTVRHIKVLSVKEVLKVIFSFGDIPLSIKTRLKLLIRVITKTAGSHA